MSKNRIGIIMGRIYKNINKKLLSGMLEQARGLGYSSYVFTLNEECSIEKITFGEKNLFHALNFSQLDGIVYAPYTFASSDYYGYIDQYLQENCSKPVVRIGIETDKFIPVWYDDKNEISELTFHLIYEHNCRRLLCLTGPKEFEVAHNRAKGFAEAMRSAGLNAADTDIIFGDFWVYAARKLAAEIADGTRDKPDGIVCTNDTMAISLCDALIEKGISVPEDILVTGYDGYTEARMHVPAITTYQTSHEMLGRKAVCLLYETITGNKPPLSKNEKGLMLCRESCGCNSNNESFDFHEFDQRMSEESLMDCTLSAAFHEAVSLNDLVEKMFSMQYKFMDRSRFFVDRLFLCLCDDWDHVVQTSNGREYRTAGYSDTMYLIGSDGSRITFPLEEILPVCLDTNELTTTFFLPVHFQDQCFGYIALETNAIDDFNMEYIRYCREVNNGLKYLCTQNELKRLNYRRKIMQSRDELTGLYIFDNCKDMWTEIQDEAEICREQVYLIAVSAGGLRHIENAESSAESDRYLVLFADILVKCCSSREKIFKTGEKSFVIIGSESEPDERIAAYLKQVEEYVWRQSIAVNEKYLVYAKTDSEIIPVSVSLSADEAAEKIKSLFDRLDDKMKNRLSDHIHYSELLELRRDIFIHPEINWNGEICSKRLNISKSYFHKLYMQMFGASFMQDLQESRLNCARKLLMTTSLVLTDIAEKCGYDYYNFMRVFKKEMGMTPTQFRKNCK